jgi:hypothetical protein
MPSTIEDLEKRLALVECALREVSNHSNTRIEELEQRLNALNRRPLGPQPEKDAARIDAASERIVNDYLAVMSQRSKEEHDQARRAIAGAYIPVDRSAQTLTDGSPVTDDHKEINPATGQQKGYVVLSAEERAKGFVRHVRRAYSHVGAPGPQYPLADLTDEQKQRHIADRFGYVKWEQYPDGETINGRFWTQAQLDRVGKGCNTVTTMGQALAETYARDPSFYGGTMCCACRNHFPVGPDGEFIWEGTTERVGT